MQENQPSRTSIYAAIFRALHQTVDEDPKILADWIASRLIDVSSGDYQVRLAECEQPRARVARSNIVLRGRYAEDCLGEAIARGVRQFLVLGAGLETFAYRQPPWASALQIFEADHPATQAWKKEKLAMAGIIPPPNLTLSRFRPTQIVTTLRRIGFSRVEHFTPEQARQRYFIERGDGLAGLDGGQVTQLMRAIV